MLKKVFILIGIALTLASAFNGGNVTGLSVITSPYNGKVYYKINHSIGVNATTWAAWNICFIECSADSPEKNAYTFSLLQKALLDQRLFINLNNAYSLPVLDNYWNQNYLLAIVTDWSISMGPN